MAMVKWFSGSGSLRLICEALKERESIEIHAYYVCTHIFRPRELKRNDMHLSSRLVRHIGPKNEVLQK